MLKGNTKEELYAELQETTRILREFKRKYASKRCGDATLIQQFIYKKYRLYIPLNTFGEYSFRKLLSALIKKSYLIAKIEERKREVH